MKSLMIASLILWSFAPLHAATLDDAPRAGRDARSSASAFGGARIRVALGGDRRATKVRAGLTLTSLRTSATGDGARAYRYAEGFEFGFTEKRAPALTLAGYRLTPKRLGAAQGDAQDERDGGGPSTLGIAAIVAGGLLVTLGIGYLVLVESFDCDADEECS